MFVFILGLETTLAIHCMPDEIAADRAGDVIKSQGIESRAQALINNHAARLADRGKRFVNSVSELSQVVLPRLYQGAVEQQWPLNRNALGFRELAQFVAQRFSPS